MAASQNDLAMKTGASTVTTLAAPGRALAASSITVGSTTNYPTDTGIIIAIRVVDSNGDLVAGTYSEFTATVTSGTTLAISTTPVYGTDQVYAAGSTTQVFIPLSAYAHNRLIDGFTAEHNQDGTHSDITATTADFTGAVSANTISEHTAGSGVTVDGLLIKDNYVVGSATSGIKNESLGTAATDLGSAWQTGTPAATGFSSKTDDTLLYKQVGKTVFCNFKIEGTSNATTLTFTLPVAAKNTTSFGGIRAANSGAFSVNPGLLTFAASSATATGNRDHSGAAFTNTGTKGMQGFFFYEAA